MTEKKIRFRERKPLFALALSFFLTGLGQLYNGRVRKGILFFLISSIAPFLFFQLCVVGPGRMLIGFLLLSLAASLGTYIWAAVDAWKEAQHTGKNFRLKFYNKLYVYILLAVGLNLISVGGIVDWNDICFWALPYRMSSGSMQPTLLPGDLIMADKRIDHSAENHGLKRGELVVFNNPRNKTNQFVKRIIGLPGDKIELKGMVLSTNGERRTGKSVLALEGSPGEKTMEGMEETIKCQEEGDLGAYVVSYLKGTERADLTVTVPEGCCFVLGDNRDNSMDSRHFGSISLDEVVARAKQVYFSIDPEGGIRWMRIGTDFTTSRKEGR